MSIKRKHAYNESYTRPEGGGRQNPRKTHPPDKQPKPTSRSTPQAKQEPSNTPPDPTHSTHQQKQADHTEDSEKQEFSRDRLVNNSIKY